MKADPTHQVTLLEVAELDSRAAELRHQRAHLPESPDASLTAERTALTDQVRDARIVVDDLTVEQAKADREVEQVRNRRERDRNRMDTSQITSPRTSSGCRRRRSRWSTGSPRSRTPARGDRGARGGPAGARRPRHPPRDIDARLAELVAQRDEKQAGIDASLAEVGAARGPATADMPDDLMALYERLREQKGIGAALLRARQCGGCNMSLDASDWAGLRAADPDEVIRCEECQRILVRTDESGL